MEKLQLLDLFSGIGGFSLGLEASGYFETVAFCEIDSAKHLTLKRYWPGVIIYEDIEVLSSERLRTDGVAVDAICGGFPCQDLSYSGKGAGLDGERSGLWREFARLIRELRPSVVFVENVTALLGRGMGVVLGDLASLGYDAEWHCIPASAVGAPHERDRVWIVAYPTGERLSRQGRFIKSINPTPSAFREAEWLVSAVQGDAMPFVCRRHDGVSKRLAEIQLHSLGNAVVPQIPEALAAAVFAGLRPLTDVADL